MKKSTDWEKFFKLHIQQRTSIWIYTELSKLNKKIQLYNGQTTWTEIKRRSNQQPLGQCETTTNYHHTPTRMPKLENEDNTQYWQGCRETVPFINCWWNIKIIPPLWKIVWQSLIKLNMQLLYNQQLHFWAFMPEKPAYKCAQQFYWQEPKTGNKPDVPQWANGCTNCHRDHGILLSSKKERNYW